MRMRGNLSFILSAKTDSLLTLKTAWTQGISESTRTAQRPVLTLGKKGQDKVIITANAGLCLSMGMGEPHLLETGAGWGEGALLTASVGGTLRGLLGGNIGRGWSPRPSDVSERAPLVSLVTEGGGGGVVLVEAGAEAAMDEGRIARARVPNQLHMHGAKALG